MRRNFVVLDVFTDKPLTGNQLAVVLDTDGLDADAMQAIAREFNLSETVFVFPPDDAAHRARLRIFTRAAELPFAGHPTIGSAVLLGRGKPNAPRDLVLEEKIGLVRCHVRMANERLGYARFVIPRLPAQEGTAPARDVVAAALGLAPGDIGCGAFQPARWSAGAAFYFLPVRDVSAVARVQPAGDWGKIFNHEGALNGAYIFTQASVDSGNHFHARKLAPHMNVGEDPATGSAAAAFSGMIAAVKKLSDGEHLFRVEQGFEMGRPSVMEIGITMKGGMLTQTTIGGSAVIVSEGVMEA